MSENPPLNHPSSTGQPPEHDEFTPSDFDGFDGYIRDIRQAQSLIQAHRANPAVRLTWGIEPRSPHRRRRAILTLLAPSLITLCVYIMILVSAYHVSWRRLSLLDIAMSGVFASPLALPLILLLRCRPVPPILLRPESREELTMAGLTGSGRLWGANSPGLCGVLLAALGQVVLPPVLLFIHWIYQNWTENGFGLGGPASLFVGFIFFTMPPFLLVCGAFLEAALRVLAPSRLGRLAGISLLALAFGAYCVVVVLMFLTAKMDSSLLGLPIIFGEAWTVYVVYSFWRRAARRLEVQP